MEQTLDFTALLIVCLQTCITVRRHESLSRSARPPNHTATHAGANVVSPTCRASLLEKKKQLDDLKAHIVAAVVSEALHNHHA